MNDLELQMTLTWVTILLAITNKFGVKKAEWHVYQCDFDLITLVLKLNLDTVKMYHHTKNKASRSRS